MAVSIVDELITLLGLRTDPKAAAEGAKMEGMLGKITKTAVGAGTALIGTATAIKAMAVAQAEAIDSSGKFADSIGVSYERVQELDYAAGKTGGSGGVAALRSDLEGLQKSMSSTVPGEYNSTLYQLGVSARDASGKLRNVDDVLLDVGDKLKGMSTQKQAQFASKLGISQPTLTLIKNGRAEVNGMTSEARKLGLVLDESAKVKAARWTRSLFTAKAVVDGLSKSVSVGLLPAMSDSLDLFTGWVVESRAWITSGITQLLTGVAKGFDLVGDGLKAGYAIIKPFVGGMGDLFKGLDATQPIALAVATAIGLIAVSLVAAQLPTLAIIAGLTALVLIAEDVYAAFNGQDSILGGWLKDFSESYPALSKYLGGLVDLGTSIAKVFGGSVIAAVEAFGTVFAKIFGAAATLIGTVASGIERFVSATGLASAPAAMAAQVSAAVPGAAPVSAGAMAGGGSSTTNNTVNQTINGAGDPRAVGQESVNRMGLGSAVQQKNPGAYGPRVG